MKIKILLSMIFLVAVTFSAAIAENQVNNTNSIQPDSLQSIPIEKSFSADEELFPFIGNIPIDVLKIQSGEVELESCNSLVRVILVDVNSIEYLVYEAYPLLCDSNQFQINNVCEETCNLDTIIPHSLKIQIINATIKIDKIDLSISRMLMMSKFSGAALPVQEEWYQEKIKKLNEQIQKLGLKWTAGETEISKLSYEAQKKLFGLDRVPNLQGAEFYVGGIFETCAGTANVNSSNYSDSSLIKSFDWRNRHGANLPSSPYYDGDPSGSGWITSVKRQRCADCWAHSAVGATEAVSNLFFNQHINLDLSEQELVSCANAGSCRYGGNPGAALRYIRDDGIVDESCFPESGTDEPCSNICSEPYELIEINGYHWINPSEGDGFIKRQLLEYGPLAFGISSWWHCMVLVGYQLDSDDGAPIWILKNSWGTSWGEDGYGRIKVDLADIYLTYAIENPVISNQQPFEVLCLDRDGDGYYNWGISKNKPESCSRNIPDEMDCDDSDPLLGPFDKHGNCLENSRNINSMVTFAPDPSTYSFTPDTTDCQDGAFGKFSFDATLTNINEKELSNLFVEVDELTNNNLLLTDEGIKGEGDIFRISTDNENVAFNADVELKGAQFFEGGWGGDQTVSKNTIVDGIFLPRGQQWNQGAVWWDSRDGMDRYIEITLDDEYTINSFIVQADDNDAYKLYHWDLTNNNWQLTWDVPNFDAIQGGGMVTRPNPEDNNERYFLSNPITTDALLFRGNMDYSDRLFSVSEIQAITGTANDYSDGILGPDEYADIPFTVCLQNKNPFSFFVNVLGVAVDYPAKTVTSAGQIWMDRNLGASRVAESSNDFYAYGDLYQWGRGADGHQVRTSTTTDILSSSDDPGHGLFITVNSYPYNWMTYLDDALWQGESGNNNPCPAGFRLPIETELDVERDSWTSQNSTGAFASPLKLVVAGYRYNYNGSFRYTGSYGSYWSSTVNGSSARRLNFGSSYAGMNSSNRAGGFSVRCLKD